MRILAWEDGAWRVQEGISFEEARALALGPVPVWVRAEGVDPTVWDQLGHWFDLHPLALEDIRSRQRPKVEDYPGFTFVVARIPRMTEEGPSWAQPGLFLGEGFVMTASPDALPELDEAERRLMGGTALARSGELDEVFHAVVDVVVDAWFPFMDALEERLEEVEDQVIDRATRENLRDIRDLKDHASRTRKVLVPLRDAMLSLERGEHPNIRRETRLFLRDVADHTMRLAERLDHVREMALMAQETWNATLANQQNETMKRLTLVAALLLFPGLVAAIGGMNFERGFPDWSFWSVTGGILGFVVAGAVVAAWRRWI